MISFFTGAALIVLVSTFQSHNLSAVEFRPKRVSEGESTGQEVHLVVVVVVVLVVHKLQLVKNFARYQRCQMSLHGY